VESHVQILREFRDHFMVTNYAGKAFIDLYYIYSPPVADFIAGHDTVRLMVRWILLPVVGMSWIALKLGAIPVLIFMLLFGFSLISLAGDRSRFRKENG
jgi:predicted ABC-type exoprotein transport system permease subunit